MRRPKERSYDNTGSSNNGDHSDRSNTEHSPPPPQLRVRKKTVNSENKERRRTVSQIVPKESEKPKIVPTASKSRKISQAVPPLQEVTLPPPLTTQPVELPPLPSGRTLLDIDVSLNIDQLFGLLFTDCEFYRTWLFVSIDFPATAFSCTKMFFFFIFDKTKMPLSSRRQYSSTG